VELSMSRSCCGACAGKASTNRNSRTGCSTLRCRWRRMLC
jgi:hypothetical protein